MAEFIDFLPLFQEPQSAIRARMDADVNAGLQISDPRWVDTREGSFYRDLTEVVLLEIARLWDALSMEVPAAAFPAFAWGDYLDAHASVFGLERKASVPATGVVLFTGDDGAAVSQSTEVGAVPTGDTEPPTFVTTESGTLSTTIPTPTGLGSTTNTTGGTLAAGTYYYRVTAFTHGGETLPSSEISQVTTGSTSRVDLSWSAVPGAAGYYVYRRTSGAHERLVMVDSGTTYTDTGAVTPDPLITVPTEDASGGRLRLPVEATTTGAVGNVAPGAITDLNTPVPGVNAVVNEIATTGGTEPETDEELRTRILASFQGVGAGTENDYRRWALSRPGVGQVHVRALGYGLGTVQVVLMDNDGQPVSAEVVEDVQLYLDPIPGQGKGQAPIGATVYVETPAVVPIDVTATVALNSGYSLDGTGGTVAVRAAIVTALSEYLDNVAVGEDVVYEHVKAQFFRAPGVFTISGVTVEGGTANVTLDENPPEVAGLGTVSLVAA
jgi:uncharacterized phage protein gp47/JayE